MKKVTYTFEVSDFCPDNCEAFSPIRAIRNDKMHCLYDSQCAELHRVLEMNADRNKETEAADGTH